MIAVGFPLFFVVLTSVNAKDLKQMPKGQPIIRRLPDCNITISHTSDMTEGLIKSPKHPYSYPGGIDCYYEINLVSQYRLELQIYQLRITPNDTDLTGHTGLLLGPKFCGIDYLEINDGFNEVNRICGFATNGSQDQQQIIETPGSYLSLHLHSERLKVKPRGSGFYLIWKAIRSCEDAFHTGMEGTITSVNFPLKYLNNQHCSHHIQVPPGYMVALQFEFFHLEPLDHITRVCENDYIQVYNYRRCGNWMGRENRLKFYSDPTNNHLSFSFHSNPVVTGPGFKAKYK